MKYKNNRTGREMEVGEHERVRRQILERIGWFLVEDENIVATPGESPATVATTIQGEIERDDFTQIKGVGNELAQSLHDAYFDTYSHLAHAPTGELMKIPGISEKKAESIVSQATVLLMARYEQ